MQLCSCPDRAGALSDHSSSITAGNVSTALFIVGGVGIAGGAALWFTAPHEEHDKSAWWLPRHLRISPLIGAGTFGIGAAARFE